MSSVRCLCVRNSYLEILPKYATISGSDNEGSGGTTMKAAAAQQGRQRLYDKEGSGGATTKAAAARQSAAAR